MKTIFEDVGKTRDQWGKLLLYSSVAAAATLVAAEYPLLGQYTQIGVATAFLGPLGVYGARITRYFQNVRYRKAKCIRTGDGGNNYVEVICEKYWNDFWPAPLDHLKLPIQVFVTQVDLQGHSEGGVRSGKCALKSIAKHDADAVPLAHNEMATEETFRRLKELRFLLDKARISISWVTNFDLKYESLSDWSKNVISENDYYELVGLEIMERDGLTFPQPY